MFEESLRLYRHYRALKKQHHALVMINPFLSCRGKACFELNAITLSRPVCGQRSYAVFLHELGHIASPNQRHMIWSVLDDEIDAWRWAMNKALIWTPRMHDLAVHCLSTYFDGLGGTNGDVALARSTSDYVLSHRESVWYKHHPAVSSRREGGSD